MRYAEPETVEEGVALLASTAHARCLAGGAALVARLNAGLDRPPLLVSLHRIPELFAITASPGGPPGSVSVGAMVKHRTVAAEDRLIGAMRVVRSAAGQLAHPGIRNMGTIGGSVCLADPNTEIPNALIAAEASVEIAGPGGRRMVPVQDVITGRYQTALAPDEIVTRISIPAGPMGIHDPIGHHLRFSRVAGDYPTVSISLVVAVSDGVCCYARVVVGSCGPVPLHVDAADQRLVGTALGADDIAAAGQLLASAAEPIDDVRGTAGYRRTLIPRLLARALEQAVHHPQAQAQAQEDIHV